jgi:DNA-binding CsgD family transcriptional regulator
MFLDVDADLAWVSADLTNGQFLAEPTVKAHVTWMLAKLGLRDRSKPLCSPTKAA